MWTLNSFVKQGTLAELESDTTGEERHRVLQPWWGQQQPLKKKSGSVSHYCQHNQLFLGFFTNIYFLWTLAEKFLRLRKSTSPAPHALLYKVQAFHSCGRAMLGPDLATRMVLRQLMKQALPLLLPVLVLSYKLPYKESYCYKASDCFFLNLYFV